MINLMSSLNWFFAKCRSLIMSSDAPATNPKIVILLSGKRKSGKDYVANIIQKRIKNYVVLRIAGPIKQEYAKMHNLNYEELLSDSAYKEQHRLKMVTWSEQMRKNDPNCFLRISIDQNKGYEHPIWILTDCRRECDIRFFKEEPQFKNSDIISLRIKASDDCRMRRGYVFTPSIDDAETECGLDNYTDWTDVVENDSLTEQQMIDRLKVVLDKCNSIS